ncbi:MAG: hypothetical protein Q9213_001816 [Squamulea squamosa]
MSIPIPDVSPISLEDLFRAVSTTTITTCIGSPFASRRSCSQQLTSSPQSKRLPNAKNKLEDIHQSVDEGFIAVTEENTRNLKYIAKSFTCSDHKALSDDFAYHWLASSRWGSSHSLSRLESFLSHMSWSVDTIKWTCLATVNTSCTSILDYLKSTELQDMIRGFLNRMAIGEEAWKSLRRLARYWFCEEHQEDGSVFETAIENLWKQCRKYWSRVGVFPRRTRVPDPKADKDTSILYEDSSHIDSSSDASMIFDFPNTIDASAKATLVERAAPSAVLQRLARPDAEPGASDHTPWNDQSIYEDMEYESEVDLHHSPVSCTRSSGSPETSHPSKMQVNSDIMEQHRVPSTFCPDEFSIEHNEAADEPPSLDSSKRGLPSPKPPRTPSKNGRQRLKTPPSFKRCGDVSNATVFNGVLARLKKGCPGSAAGLDEGYIYVFQSVASPEYIKVGRTKQTIQDREKQVDRCAGDTVPIKNEYNICEIRQQEWLERTILDTLRSMKCSFSCAHKVKCVEKLMDHHEWFKADANDVAELVQLWRQWMESDPYDKEGHLYPRWRNRIAFFEKNKSRYTYLLAEPSPFKAWSMFLNPPWWLRILMIIYEELFKDRGDLQCRWTLVRENLSQVFWDAAFWSAAITVPLVFVGCLNLLIFPIIFFGATCRIVLQK